MSIFKPLRPRAVSLGSWFGLGWTKLDQDGANKLIDFDGDVVSPGTYISSSEITLNISLPEAYTAYGPGDPPAELKFHEPGQINLMTRKHGKEEEYINTGDYDVQSGDTLSMSYSGRVETTNKTIENKNKDRYATIRVTMPPNTRFTLQKQPGYNAPTDH